MPTIKYISKLLFKDGVYEQKNQHVSKIDKTVSTAVDSNGNILDIKLFPMNTITPELQEKLSNIGYDSSSTDVKIFEVESSTFEGAAFIEFNVSDFANPGEKVLILHYDEAVSQWEIIGEQIVSEDGKVSGTFTSFSPIAIIKESIPILPGLYDVYINKDTNGVIYNYNTDFKDFETAVFGEFPNINAIGYTGDSFTNVWDEENQTNTTVPLGNPISYYPDITIGGILKTPPGEKIGNIRATYRIGDNAFNYDNNIFALDLSNNLENYIVSNHVFPDSIIYYYLNNPGIYINAFSENQLIDIMNGNKFIFIAPLDEPDDHYPRNIFNVAEDDQINNINSPLLVSPAFAEWRDKHSYAFEVEEVNPQWIYNLFAKDFFIQGTVEDFYQKLTNDLIFNNKLEMISCSHPIFKYFKEWQIVDNEIKVKKLSALMLKDYKNLIQYDFMTYPSRYFEYEVETDGLRLILDGIVFDLSDNVQDITYSQYFSMTKKERENGINYNFVNDSGDNIGITAFYNKFGRWDTIGAYDSYPD